MKTFLTHLTIAILAVSLWTPGMAQAATGSWQWQDISGQLTTRTNRPIWAMAYANGNWFYTDGQDLNHGGQVYRFDGQTQVNITNDVRNAGMNRIDDIVSDHSNTVLFLQDVVRYDNQLKVVSYQNGTYSNRTSQFQNALGIDEGVSTISGWNGTWYFFSTKARLFRWDSNSGTPARVSLPVTPAIPTTGGMKYTPGSNNHPFMVVPVRDSNWLVSVVIKKGIYGDPEATTLYRFNGTTFTAIQSNVPIIGNMYSNGQDALFMNVNQIHAGLLTGTLMAYENSSIRTVSLDGSIDSAIKNAGWNDFCPADWDGTSWMIPCSKRVYRLQNGIISDLGETRDYFVTAAGDNAGHFLLGGAVSEMGNPDPTNPLTAKLVLVTESGAAAFNPVVTTNTDTNTNTSANTDTGTGINRWTWLDPNVTSIKKDGNVTFYVGAQDDDGIKNIEILVNGAVKRACDLGSAKGNQQCAYTVYSNDYARGTDIFVNAKVTDAKDNETWTTSTTLQNEANTASPGNQVSDAGTGISQWTWLEPNQTTLKNNEKIAFRAGAQDTDGIKTIDVYVNGAIRRSCVYGAALGNQECAYDLWASDYPLNTDIFVNAKVTDGLGKSVWTQGYTIRRDGGNTNVDGMTVSGISAWSWFENTADLKKGQNVIFRSQAWAEQGLKSMEVFVNGQSKHSCNFSTASGNQDCNYTVAANDYAAGSTVSAYVKATDKNGKTMTGDTKKINIIATDGNASGSTSNTGDTHSPTAWHWLDPQKTSITTNETVRYWAEAWDNTGIKSMTHYVNGKPEYTCNYWPGTGNQKCWIEIAGRAHPAGSTFFVNTLVKDFAGNETWTHGETITITQGTIQTAANPEPTQTSISAPTPAFETWSYLSGPAAVMSGTKTTYVAAAWAEKGIRRITMYVNGKAQYPCTYWPGTGNQECRFDIIGSNYPSGTSVSINALVTDFANQDKWTELATIPVN